MKKLEKKEKFKYPIYAVNKTYSLVVKFRSLDSGEVISIGSKDTIYKDTWSYTFEPHTKHNI